MGVGIGASYLHLTDGADCDAGAARRLAAAEAARAAADVQSSLETGAHNLPFRMRLRLHVVGPKKQAIATRVMQ